MAEMEMVIETPESSGGGSVWWERISISENKERWWSRGWKKVREWSEVAAGPKWKTFIRRFIRRFNRNNKGGGAVGDGRGKFQYDPLSYPLNFDHGPGQNRNPELLCNEIGARWNPSGCFSISLSLGKEVVIFDLWSPYTQPPGCEI